MDKLSPAFLNRFTVINLEDQLEGASEKEEKEAISYIIKSENVDLNKRDDEIIKYIYITYIKRII